MKELYIKTTILYITSIIKLLIISIAPLNAQTIKPARAVSDPFHIVLLYWSMNIPGQVAMAKGVEKKIAELNLQAEKKHLPRIIWQRYVAGDGETGIERQIKQMQEAIAQKPDMIIVQPTDNAALVASLRKANALHIPVLAYDQYISGGKLAGYVTSNNYQAGFLDGEYIASKFDNRYAIKLILVEYSMVSSTVERVNGFLDALSQLQQKYNIIKTYQAVEPVSGTKAGQQILKDFPQKGSVDVVFTVNDGGGLNVVNELARAGRDEIIHATIDGDPQSVENIKQGRLTHIDSAQFCAAMGSEAVRLAYQFLLGHKIPSITLIPTYPVTKETLSGYKGWYGKVPDRFTKPWPGKQAVWDNTFQTSF